MGEAPAILLTAWTWTPEQVFAAMPRDRRVATLWSGEPDEARAVEQERARWVIIAEIRETMSTPAGAESQAIAASLAPPSAWLAPVRPVSNGDDQPPFLGGAVACLSYDLVETLEPRSADGPSAAVDGDKPWPLIQWHRCDTALAYDRRSRRWWLIAPALRAADAPGHPLVRRVAESLAPVSASRGDAETGAGAFALQAPAGLLDGRDRYIHGVRSILNHIARGDAYQVNLAHALNFSFTGSTRALFLALAARSKPWMGAYVELPDDANPHGASSLTHPQTRRALASVSPELFIDLSPHIPGQPRVITTRPMKGTRPATGQSGDELRASPKDRAELTMIVDLMRNDLGRLCLPGTVRVVSPREIESHTSVLQATATISGHLAGDSGDMAALMPRVLRALFPPGSVTGAPKVSSVRIIRSLEGFRRGAYCGCVGFICRSGRVTLNVAIRTASITGAPASGGVVAFTNATLRYPVGAGIVADSDPASEWAETLSKARVILEMSGAVTSSPAATDPPRP